MPDLILITKCLPDSSFSIGAQDRWELQLRRLQSDGSSTLSLNLIIWDTVILQVRTTVLSPLSLSNENSMAEMYHHS